MNTLELLLQKQLLIDLIEKRGEKEIEDISYNE